MVTNIDIPGGKTVSYADPVVVTFNVSEIWRGVDKQELVLKTARQGSMCGYHFEQGEEYIVYAYSYKDDLWTGICERTKLIANAGEDLQALGKGNIPTNSGSNINAGFARTMAQIPFNALESRYVWAEDAGMNLTFNLTPLNFDGFYYDLDNDAGGERLNIKIGNITDRLIKEKECEYSTTVLDVPFNYEPFGNYIIIGFMGEKYFAGYTSGSKIANFPVTLIDRSLFGQVLIDEKRDHILTTENNLTLNEGYVLRIREFNISEGTALIILEKFGGEIDRKVVRSGNTYVYEKDIRGVISGKSYTYDDPITIGKIPIIAVHIESIFAGGDAEPGAVINGIFQLSEVYTAVDPGYGILKITNISKRGITMTNPIPVALDMKEKTALIDGIRYTFSQEGTYPMMGDIILKVMDSDPLRFFIYKESIELNDLEHRGAVYTGSTPVTAWNDLNFAGFKYDVNSDFYSDSHSESFEITGLKGRIIPEGGLKYTSTALNIPFLFSKITGIRQKQLNGSYKAFGIGTNKYMVINDSDDLKLSKILIDSGSEINNKRVLYAGETWEMGEGFNFTVKNVNTSSSSWQTQLTLIRNDTVLEEKWMSQGYLFTYSEKNSSEEYDLPIFITYLDAIFVASFVDCIQLRYSWLRSSNVTRIREEDMLGVFKITKSGPDHIEMTNDQPINLIPGSRINLIGDLGFVVANSNDLRFYPADRISADVVPETTTELTAKLTTEMGSMSNTPIVADNSSMNPSDKTNKIPAVSFTTAAMSLILMAFFDRFTITAKRRLEID